MRIFIFTHIASSDNTNMSRDYRIFAYEEKTDAVQMLKKSFRKTLDKSSLKEEEKAKETEKFSKNLLQGKFYYHFRDIHTEEQVQYFGKIHTRETVPSDSQNCHKNT